MKVIADKRLTRTVSRNNKNILRYTMSNIKLKRKPKAPHNTTSYLITNKSKENTPDEAIFITGGTMKGILNNTLDYDSTDDASIDDSLQ
jgi:hypothetical protein